MDDPRRLSGPGRLGPEAMAVLARPPADGAGDETLPDDPLAVLAARHGLRSTAARPSLPAYLRLLWQRRYFIGAYATARNISTYTEARLGQIWQILTPLLNAGVWGRGRPVAGTRGASPASCCGRGPPRTRPRSADAPDRRPAATCRRPGPRWPGPCRPGCGGSTACRRWARRPASAAGRARRSEERRVGKEGRSRWS